MYCYLVLVVSIAIDRYRPIARSAGLHDFSLESQMMAVQHKHHRHEIVD